VTSHRPQDQPLGGFGAFTVEVAGRRGGDVNLHGLGADCRVPGGVDTGHGIRGQQRWTGGARSGCEARLWAAHRICPLAPSRRCPLTAISSRRVLAVGDTTALPVPPSTGTSGSCPRSICAHIRGRPLRAVARPYPSIRYRGAARFLRVDRAAGDGVGTLLARRIVAARDAGIAADRSGGQGERRFRGVGAPSARSDDGSPLRSSQRWGESLEAHGALADADSHRRPIRCSHPPDERLAACLDLGDM